MAKNFLAVSPSFVEEMKNTKAKIDRMAVFDEIFSVLDDNYETDLSYGAILNILKRKEFDYSLSTLRNLLKLIKITRKFLLDTEEMKVADFVFLSNKKTPSAYIRFVNVGISCFIADEITSWEMVEKLMDRKNDEIVDIPSFEVVQREKTENTNPDDFSILIKDLGNGINDWSAFFRDRLHLLSVLFDKSCADISREKQALETQVECMKNFKALEKKHSKCLDELKRLNELETNYKKLIFRHSELKKAQSQDKKTIEYLKDTKQQLDSEIIRLKQEISELKKTDIHMVRDMIAEIAKTKDADANQSDVSTNGKEKQKNSDLLPKTYALNSKNIVYSDKFIDLYNRLDRKVAKNILSTIRLISRSGFDDISPCNKKVIQKCAEGTPDKSTQITIKKYRIMVKIISGVINFYDVFHRKNSPYASK